MTFHYIFPTHNNAITLVVIGYPQIKIIFRFFWIPIQVGIDVFIEG
jgi:hypothetical protein